MANQALGPDGNARPPATAHATSAAPAGTKRTLATKRGDVSGKTSFIATMDVPHRKKGETRIKPPMIGVASHVSNTSGGDGGGGEKKSTLQSTSLAGTDEEDEEAHASLTTTQIASLPTATHSNAAASCGAASTALDEELVTTGDTEHSTASPPPSVASQSDRTTHTASPMPTATQSIPPLVLDVGDDVEDDVEAEVDSFFVAAQARRSASPR